jgi:hypothetical protein
VKEDARQSCDYCLAKNARPSHVAPRSLDRQKKAARDDIQAECGYFETAANCLTVLMKVVVARVNVLSRR